MVCPGIIRVMFGVILGSFQEDMKSLCSHVCAKYTPFFKEVTYVSTFKGLLQRNDQEQDRKQQNNRILDK